MDLSGEGFKNWTFMSVHNWGEDPRGTWKMNIRDKVGERRNINKLHFSVCAKLLTNFDKVSELT